MQGVTLRKTWKAHGSLPFNENSNDLQILSPDTPWVFKAKKSLDDFKSSKNLLKTFEESDFSSYNIENKVSVCTKYKKQNRTSPIQEKVKKQTNSSLSTPKSVLQQYKLSDSPITPLPDYKNMVTPDLKEALKRIGVKGLPRKKAVSVLSHVYEETHPLIGCSSSSKVVTVSAPSVSDLPKQKKSTTTAVALKRKRSKEVIDKPNKKLPKTVNSSPVKTMSQNCSFSSSDSGTTKKDEHRLSFSSDFSDNSQQESKEKVKQVSDYIINNEELYKQILTYMPLNLVKFQEELKENGITIGLQKLMNYLDEQCITFHYPRKEEYKKKQQIRTQRFRKRMIAKLSQQTQSKT